MTNRGLRDRWARLLADEAVTPEESAGLLAAAKADPSLRRALLEDARTEGWLRGMGWAQTDGGRFSSGVAARLEAEADEGRFTQRVAAAIAPSPSRRRVAAVAAAAVAVAAVALLAPGNWREPVLPGSRPPLTAILPSPSPPTPPVVAPPSAPATRRTLLAFDFEDGRTPVDWLDAPSRSCPPRPGNRYCVPARRNPESSLYPHVVGVRFEDRRSGLFQHRPGLVLAFDYWVGAWLGAKAPRIAVWINNRTQRAPYHHQIDDLRPSAWVRVEIPIEAFKPEQARHRGMRDGDVVDFVLVHTTYDVEDLLFVDNVALLAP